MNIAFVLVKHIARGGGIEKYTEELGSRLVRLGHQVRVYSMCHYGKIESRYKGMEIVPVPSLARAEMQKITASVYASIYASVDKWADILHLHHVVPGAMAGLAGMWGKPTLVQYHGLEWKRSRWNGLGCQVLKTLERMSVKANRQYTAVSRVQCDYMRDTYGIDVRYIPTGAEVKSAPAPQELYRLGLRPNEYFLFASRLVREKGAHYLIPAFRRLSTKYKLVIAGDAPGVEEYKQELRQLAGHDPRIIFPGFVEGRLLDELFGHAFAYVQPSEIEGLSIALLEAMSYGLCCLVSDIPENLEAIGDHGLAFASRDIDDLSAKLAHLLAHPEEARVISARAIAHVRAHYCWDRIAEEFSTYYTDIIAEHGRQRAARRWRVPRLVVPEK